jgi:P-type Cu+ transporter
MSCVRGCASVAKVGVDTMLTQIITMVRQAQASRVLVQRLADAASGDFLSAVIAVAITAGLADPSSLGLVAAITVLIIPARARRA